MPKDIRALLGLLIPTCPLKMDRFEVILVTISMNSHDPPNQETLVAGKSFDEARTHAQKWVIDKKWFNQIGRLRQVSKIMTWEKTTNDWFYIIMVRPEPSQFV